MKTNIFLLLVSLLTFQLCSAQFYAGVMAGANIAGMHTQNEAYQFSPDIKMTAGIPLAYKFENGLMLTAEFDFVQKGYSDLINTSPYTPQFDGSVTYNFLQFAPGALYHFGSKALQPYVYGNVYYAVAYGGHRSGEETLYTYEPATETWEQSIIMIDEDIELPDSHYSIYTDNIDFGVQGGAGIAYTINKNRFYVDAGYSRSFKPAYSTIVFFDENFPEITDFHLTDIPVRVGYSISF